MAHNDGILDANGKLISDTIVVLPFGFRNEDDALFRSGWASEAGMRHIDVSARNSVFRAPNQFRRRTISSNPDDSPWTCTK
jgi:hypothetical protein